MSEAELREIEAALEAAVEELKRQRDQNAVLVKMLVDEKTKHEALRRWTESWMPVKGRA